MSSSRNHAAWKWIAAGIAVIGLAVAYRFLPLADWIQQFTSWIRDRGALGIAAFAVSYVLGAILFLPASLFTIAAGIGFGFWRGVVIAASSATVGAGLSFLIARYLLRKRVEQWLARSEKRQAFDAAITRGDWKVVLLFRLTPLLPFAICNYFFGLTKVRFWPYLLASAVGILPGSVLYTYLGYLGKIVIGEKRERTPLEYGLLGVGLLATIILVVYITRLSKKQLRELQQRSK